MRVCAHINYGPFNNGHKRFDTIALALGYFRAEVIDNPYRSGTSDEEDGCYTIDLYPQCARCTGTECWHDYPMARYDVGPRNGLRSVRI